MVDEGLTDETKVEAAVGGEEDVEGLRQALASEREKAKGYLANWQRSQADFINYKRYIEHERGELIKSTKTSLLLGLLSVLDDLERAFASIPADLAESKWADGVRLIERKLRISLEGQGLSEIKALGEPFDPKLHEAVRQGRGKEGIVIEELQKGYRLYDRVIRPTMVVVGNGEEERKEK